MGHIQSKTRSLGQINENLFKTPEAALFFSNLTPRPSRIWVMYGKNLEILSECLS